MKPWAAAAVVVAGAAAACGPNPYEARVNGVLLADADGVAALGDAAKAPLVTLTLDQLEPEIPAGPVARLAVARDVSWDRVQKTLIRFDAAGVTPVLLVGQRRDVRAFTLADAIDGPSIQLTSTADGKFCVGPPDVNEAKCVQSSDRKHINRAFVRETIREAVKAYDLTEVDVIAAPDVEWADVVRTIDGARTCCGDTTVKVTIARDAAPPS